MIRKSLGAVAASAVSLALTVATASAHETGQNQNQPAEPYAPVPSVHYHAVITDYRATPIMAKPDDWRTLNDRAEEIGGPRGQLRELGEPIRKRKKN